MIKIYFTCGWQDNLHQKVITATPGNKGIWKNITYTDNYKKCDFLVVLDRVNQKFLDLGKNKFTKLFPKDKIIHFVRENEVGLKSEDWYRKEILPTLPNVFLVDYYYTFTSAHFIDKTYDQLKSMKYPEKNKILSTITSSKDTPEIYKRRKDFIIKCSKNLEIDIFGKGWKHELDSKYKGELGCYHQRPDRKTSKSDGLIDYKYSLCLENYPDEPIPSEKITDAILCWCIPIYSGSEITKSYFPQSSFYLIDINDQEVFTEIKDIIKQEINIDGLSKARDLILDKYNIWEQIYQIINDREFYEINYKIC